MREQFERLVELGPLPADADLDEVNARPYAEALDALTEAPTAEEAVALVGLFPPDESTSLGFAWSLAHAIEASPDWPIWSALDDRNWWVTYLRERCERAGIRPPT